MTPQVSIVMGSDSDLPVMQEATKVLEDFGIAHEVLVLSAHRSPDETTKYAKAVQKRGVKVVIAGAGGAAHLPGVIAALFPLPVIGVPIKTKTLGGLDSFFSIAQMPPGVPVATVSINGAKNAGILAAQILAVHDKGLQKTIKEYKKGLAKSVKQKLDKLTKLGAKEYLKLLEH